MSGAKPNITIIANNAVVKHISSFALFNIAVFDLLFRSFLLPLSLVISFIDDKCNMIGITSILNMVLCLLLLTI